MDYMYYALVMDTNTNEYFIIKSEDFFLIQEKIKSIADFPYRYNSVCNFLSKKSVDRGQSRYHWSYGGEVNLHSIKKYDIYFHRCGKRKKLIPEFELEGDEVSVMDVIKDAISVTYIQKRDNVRIKHMLKKCRVKLVHVSSGNLISATKT